MNLRVVSLVVGSCLASAAQAQLYSNASNWGLPNSPIGLSTGPTTTGGAAAPAGQVWSELQSSGGFANSTAGFSALTTGPFRLADDFTIPAGQNWNISDIHFFGYVTGSPGGTNPYSAWTLQIWGASGPGVGVPVFGDAVTNRMTSETDTNILRIFNNTPGTTRIVRDVQLNVGVVLGPGTYWLDWSNSGGFVPSLTLPGARTTAGWNGMQQVSGIWAPVSDPGTPAGGPAAAQDFPFIINGVPAPGSIAVLGLGGLLAARRRRG